VGDDWLRPELCREALRLGRMLAELAPHEPEVHGLVALMEIQASRFRARVDPAGRPVTLTDQNRGRWDQLLIRRGFTALLRAGNLDRPVGPYVLQAAIAACHAQARRVEDTDWERIAALYETLLYLAPSPVAQLNHAVAEVTASHVSPAPEDLPNAVTALLLGAAETRAEFNAEPTVFRWIFRRDQHQVTIQILELDDDGWPPAAGARSGAAAKP
jgi:predicted RNA polymerase sigma factor